MGTAERNMVVKVKLRYMQGTVKGMRVKIYQKQKKICKRNESRSKNKSRNKRKDTRRDISRSRVSGEAVVATMAYTGIEAEAGT